jgi:hypothetical protein
MRFVPRVYQDNLFAFAFAFLHLRSGAAEMQALAAVLTITYFSGFNESKFTGLLV